MQIIETLVLEQHEGLFDILSGFLALDFIDELDVPVFRLEIDPELVILIYKLNAEQQVRNELLDNIFPHLKSVIIASERDSFGEWNFTPAISERLNTLEGEAAVILALEQSKDLMEKSPDYIIENGFSLGKRSRLLFWNPENKDSIKKVWKIAWGDLLKSS